MPLQPPREVDTAYTSADGTTLSPNDFTYSQAATVAAYTDFLHFLTALHIPSAALKSPPAAGWPSLTAARLAPLAKTAAVTSLLAQLPYLDRTDEDWRVAPETSLADFAAPMFDEWLDARDGGRLRVATDGPFAVPPHVVGLTFNGRRGALLLLDTLSGLVYWPECPLGETALSGQSYAYADDYDPTPTANGDDATPDAQAEDEGGLEYFRAGAAWPVADFFEVVKGLFWQGRFLVRWDGEVVDVEDAEDDEDALEAMRAALHAHGWPAAFQREEGMDAVRALEERFG